jgi:hypothetical protein
MDIQVPRLELRTGLLGDLPASKLDELLRKAPAIVFENTGVVVPVAQRIYDENLKPGKGVLNWNGETLADVELDAALTPANLAQVIEEHAAKMLLAVQLEYHLTKLKTLTPALTAAAIGRISMESLLAGLRSRLELRQSIRNLQGVLEEMLTAFPSCGGSAVVTSPKMM